MINQCSFFPIRPLSAYQGSSLRIYMLDELYTTSATPNPPLLSLAITAQTALCSGRSTHLHRRIQDHPPTHPLDPPATHPRGSARSSDEDLERGIRRGGVSRPAPPCGRGRGQRGQCRLTAVHKLRHLTAPTVEEGTTRRGSILQASLSACPRIAQSRSRGCTPPPGHLRFAPFSRGEYCAVAELAWVGEG